MHQVTLHTCSTTAVLSPYLHASSCLSWDGVCLLMLSFLVVNPCLAASSTQYKTVLDALRSRKDRFLFEDVEICLKNSVMAFM